MKKVMISPITSRVWAMPEYPRKPNAQTRIVINPMSINIFFNMLFDSLSVFTSDQKCVCQTSVCYRKMEENYINHMFEKWMRRIARIN